jgi:hypothetical protein
LKGHEAGLAVDLDFGDVDAVGEGVGLWVVDVGVLEAVVIDACGQRLPGRDRPCDIGQGDAGSTG